MAGMTSSGQAESDSLGTASKDLPDVRLVGGEAATLEEKVRRLEAQNRELANAALTDPLTGLLNHRASHEQLDVELQRAGREQYEVAVLALDIDFFNGLNDSWGHVWGDKILRRVAERFEADLRPGDICGRLGGDEFVIALPKSNAQEGEAIFERLRVTVALLEFDPVHIPVTVSAGTACFPFDATTVTELLAVADQALYRANCREETAASSTRPTWRARRRSGFMSVTCAPASRHWLERSTPATGTPTSIPRRLPTTRPAWPKGSVSRGNASSCSAWRRSSTTWARSASPTPSCGRRRR